MGSEISYALSSDGLFLESQGRCAASLLPKADTVVAMLADADVSWHRITLPKAPASKLPAALAGLLEEAVLEEPGSTHFALAPQASAGQPVWVAAVNRPWLRSELAALEQAGVFIDRVVPSSWPDDPPSGHFAQAEGHEDESPDTITLTWAHPDGVATLRLQGGLARAVIPQPAPPGTRWSATPSAAAVAEHWLGLPVNVMPPAQRLLQAARTLWNLRQFDLARRHRGTRALRDVMRRLLSPEWRAARIGLVALAAAHVVGLNLWAWHQAAAVQGKRQAMVNVLQTTFPQVRAVLDAPVQMQREAQALRALAGKPGETDFEPMLQAAANAWPTDQPPVDNLHYENGRLTLSAAGWGEAQIEEFRSRLRPAGWQAEMSTDARVTVTRAGVGERS